MSDVIQKRRVTEAYDLDYDTMRRIASESGGWLRSSGGPEGETAEVRHEGVDYTFTDRALIQFLYAVKDNHTNILYAAKDLLDYIDKSEKQPASVFVRDAIIARAKEVRAKLEGRSE